MSTLAMAALFLSLVSLIGGELHFIQLCNQNQLGLACWSEVCTEATIKKGNKVLKVTTGRFENSKLWEYSGSWSNDGATYTCTCQAPRGLVAQIRPDFYQMPGDCLTDDELFSEIEDNMEI